ncbi:MAG: hypothetical protein OEW67_04690 [Cyclobacteriaceae bacterium]|nr:hypothetical protein [Cyclobacteriaceae bacterium]
MLDKLTISQSEIANDIINRGLVEAAFSLEQIIQSEVNIETIDFLLNNENDTQLFTLKDSTSTHYLIETVIKGEFKGVCYLVLSKDDVNKIHKKCLSANILESNAPNDIMMKKAILTEIDNMLSAAVITEFANRLNVNIYGDVPKLRVVEQNEANQIIRKEAKEYNCLLHFNAVLHAKELDISPDFLWLLDDDFVNNIKKLATN